MIVATTFYSVVEANVSNQFKSSPGPSSATKGAVYGKIELKRTFINGRCFPWVSNIDLESRRENHL